MHKDNREDIFKEGIEGKESDLSNYLFLTLLSKNINVGIIGGGRAAFIKAKTFLNHGCNVTILARDIIEDIKALDCHNLKIIQGEYKEEFIKDKHLIVIALPKEEKNLPISHCRENYKIFIDCSEPKAGNAVMPAQGHTKNTAFALNTLGGNPSLSVKLKGKIGEVLKGYDHYIEFINPLRNRAKELKEYKKEIINFINSEDYRFFYEKNKEVIVLQLFFSTEMVDFLLGKKE